MKKWTLFLGCYFALCLVLAACTANQPAGEVTTPEEPPADSQQELVEQKVDDLAALYLQVLNDLWAVDSGLNADIAVAGLDLSGTSLTEGEQATVALLFGETHDVTVVQGTLEELTEAGYISREPLSVTGSDTENQQRYYTYWEDGCHFSITESEKTEDRVRFDARKWRSGKGAYFFTDCTARRGFGGGWSAYTVGGQAIS